MLGSRILTKEWQALELGTLKELEHIMPSLLNTKHTSLAEMVIMRVDQRHGKIFISSFSNTRHTTGDEGKGKSLKQRLFKNECAPPYHPKRERNWEWGESLKRKNTAK